MGYEIEEAKRLVIKAGIELVESGLIARTWGNISARISCDQFVITPSGRDYISLKPEDLVIVDLDGNYDGNIKPSSEKGVHAACYLHRQDVNFVIHTHQVNASALSVLGKNIPLGKGISDETKKILGPKLLCAEYGLSSTKKLTNAVSKMVENNPDCNQVLMRYHGAVCYGADYDSAFKVAYTLEELSGKIYEHYVEEPIATEPSQTETVLRQEDITVIKANIPYINRISKLGKTMRAYSDDLAQIAGPTISCVKADATPEQIAKAKGAASAVFLEGEGALCYGVNEDEAEAVALVLEKACQAAYLGYKKNTPAVKLPGAIIERIIYQKKYSTLKDK